MCSLPFLSFVDMDLALLRYYILSIRLYGVQVYHIFITLTCDLNFLLKSCRNYQFIVKIIFTKLQKKKKITLNLKMDPTERVGAITVIEKSQTTLRHFSIKLQSSVLC